MWKTRGEGRYPTTLQLPLCRGRIAMQAESARRRSDSAGSSREHLDERCLRAFAVAEAKVPGRGGISQALAQTGLARATIRAGLPGRSPSSP